MTRVLEKDNNGISKLKIFEEPGLVSFVKDKSRKKFQSNSHKDKIIN